jgi:4-hydroxybenzoate polyprenyltransferase
MNVEFLLPLSPHRSLWSLLITVLAMIKFHHSLFALPFALTAMVVAAKGWPSAWTLFWIVVACVAARSMAMAYNRLMDRDVDARNPRTQDRALPAGLVTVSFTRGFIILCAAIFVLAAAMLNTLCLALSPIAIVVLLGYSHCKRHTEGSHFVLGAALGIAPLGAWIAVRGSLDGLPVFLALGVLLWTAGFDIIYSCLDVEVDRREGLHSLPARVGIGPALRGAACLHAFSVVCFALFLIESGLSWTAWIGLGIAAVLLIFEHRQVRPDDLSRVNHAFFTFNAVISVVFFLTCIL